MPSPKDGKAGTAVEPAIPAKADEADKADPGLVAVIKALQLQTKTGKYGAAQSKPAKPPETKEEKATKKSWIEIEMVDEEDQPVSGEAYRITLADGSVAEGTLDEKGIARLDDIEPGTCKITFANLDAEAWQRA
jgi:type VI secretion system secreted protein VgrG